MNVPSVSSVRVSECPAQCREMRGGVGGVTARRSRHTAGGLAAANTNSAEKLMQIMVKVLW